MQESRSGWLLLLEALALDSDVVWAPRNMLVTPFHHQDVLALLFQLVGHIIEPVTKVLNQNLFTGYFRTIDSNQKHVPSCQIKEKVIQ